MIHENPKCREETNKPFNIRHRSFYFAKEIILFVSGCRYEWVNRCLFSQLIRSSTSIGANLVEGRAGRTKKDWVNFYVIELKSSNETKYWLCLIRETVAVDKGRLNELINEADEISKIIASIILNADK